MLVLLCALCVALGACAGPIGAIRADPKVVQAELARSATTTGDPSWSTRNVLYENGLFDLFDDHPEDALAQMHKLMMATQGDPDVLFALAELSYIHGRNTGLREYSAGVRGLRLRVSVPRRRPAWRRDDSTPDCGSRRTCTTGLSRRPSLPSMGWRSSRGAAP